MKILLFKPRFAPLVLDGTKRQTIRPKRRRPIRPWDELSLRQWTGLPYRSKQLELLQSVRSMTCEIEIETTLGVRQGGSLLGASGLELLAKADGFPSVPEFQAFFAETHGLPFVGDLICWE